jgi:hypothetical protein
MIVGRRVGAGRLGCVIVAVTAALLAGAAGAPARGPGPAAGVAKPFFDSRSRSGADHARIAIQVRLPTLPLTGSFHGASLRFSWKPRTIRSVCSP